MTTYKYTDATRTVVHIIDDDGKSRSSCAAESLPAETVIIPPDALTPQQEISNINQQAQSIIFAAYPLWYQANCASGVYPVAVADAMRAGIASVIAESNRCSDLVLAGQPYSVNWPTIGG